MKTRKNNLQLISCIIISIILSTNLFLPSAVFAQKGVEHKIITTLAGKDKRWALIIGVDHYQDEISPLYGSVNDAKALRNTLIANAEFPENQVILMTTDSTDPDLIPTRGNILDSLNKLSRQVPPEGLVLISFSGHGVSIGNDAFLIPADGKIYENAELLRERSIDVLRIKKAIEATNATQVLMLLDACRNDPLKGKGDMPNKLTAAYNNGFNFDTKNKGIKAFATIYATSLGDRAFEFKDKQTGQYRGFFSYAIEEGLKGQAANRQGEITLGSLIDYIKNTVEKRVYVEMDQRQVPYPIMEGFGSQLVVAISNITGGSLEKPVLAKASAFADQALSEMMLGNPVKAKKLASEALQLNSELPLALAVSGWAKYKLKYTQEASDDLEKAIRLEPQNPLYLARLIFVYQDLSQKGLADKTANAVLRILSVPKTAFDYYSRALSNDYLGKTDSAISDYSKAIELNSQFASAYINRGSSYDRKKDFEAAIIDYTKVIELNPKFTDAYKNRGLSYYNRENYDAAIRDYTKLIELNLGDADAFNNRGNSYANKQEYDAAIQDFTKAIQLNPQSSDAYNNRGLTYFYKQNYDVAIQDFTKAIELNLQNADAFNNRGFSYYKKHDYDAAIRDYTKAIQLNPLENLAYNNRGLAYYDKQDYDTAIRDYTKSIELNPQDSNTYFSRGNSFSKLLDYDAAIRDYSKTIGLNPKNYSAYFNRGNSYFHKHDYDATIRDCTKAIELNPQYASAYIVRGNSYDYTKDHDAAISDFTKAIELNPQSADAYLFRGFSYILSEAGKESFDAAFRDCTKAIELNPELFKAYLLRGLINNEKQNFEAAIRDYTKAIELHRQSADAYKGRAISYEKLNKSELAAADWRKYEELTKK